jgi:hypothetical protein
MQTYQVKPTDALLQHRFVLLLVLAGASCDAWQILILCTYHTIGAS